MTKFLSFSFAVMLCLASPFTFAAQAKPIKVAKTQAATVNPAAQQTYKDIEKTLGFVPEFLRAYPEVAISGAWEEMKSFQMGNKTALNGKQKELIGLAVSSQVPCHYCTYFHTKASKANGATDAEVKEAIAMAALTRHWSTWLNGQGSELTVFHNEVDQVMKNVKAKMDAGEKMPEFPATANTTEAVLEDIKAMFGFVPTFYRNFPEPALVGAWRNQRDLELNPNTALSGKDKALIGIAVAAQIPCSYCNYFDTQAAMKLEGATAIEVQEAITMAGIVRHWSTVLNGNLIDEKKFRAEVDRIFKKPAPRMMRTGSSTESPSPDATGAAEEEE